MYSVIGCGNMILWKPSSVSHFITYCNSVIHHFVTKLRWFIIHSISRFGLELLAHHDSLSYDSNKNNRQTDKHPNNPLNEHHYCDVVMGVIASQITSLAIVYSTVYSDSRSKKTSKLRVTGLCAWNSPVTDEFPAQMASNAENVSIWWRHHVLANFSEILASNNSKQAQIITTAQVIKPKTRPVRAASDKGHVSNQCLQ